MTIRLLCDRPPYPTGALLTLTAAEETSLVAQKVADTNLAGGFVYAPPTPERADSPTPSRFWNLNSSGAWAVLPLGALSRLRVTGGASGGTFAYSLRNADQLVSAEPAETIAAGASDVFPVYTDDNLEIMVTITGTATAEIY